MCNSFNVRKLVAIAVLVSSWFARTSAEATIVRFQTSLGSIDVRLFNSATPLTVANFLGYANANRYDNTFIHRTPPGFVVQGGGFYFVPPSSTDEVVDPANPDPFVMNEPGISNLRGTIAMAKLGNNPDSATSQWFFNVRDNNGAPSHLDTTNGGFTVFGRVIRSMAVVDAIDQLPQADLDGIGGTLFDEVPLRGMSGEPLANRLVFVTSVDVVNTPAGDYDLNGVVNNADYILWRITLGSPYFVDADGNGNGIVDAADYVVWRKSFGQTSGSGSANHTPLSVPEPTAALLLVAGGLLSLATRRRRRRPSGGKTV